MPLFCRLCVRAQDKALGRRSSRPTSAAAGGANAGASARAELEAEAERLATRFFAALVLHDVIQEVPMEEVRCGGCSGCMQVLRRDVRALGIHGRVPQVPRAHALHLTACVLMTPRLFPPLTTRDCSVS